MVAWRFEMRSDCGQIYCVRFFNFHQEGFAMATRFIFAAIFAATLPSIAEAALISTDTGFGVGTASIDEATGKTWLKFSVQSGQSFEEFSSVLGTGNYTGFRLAAGSEVSELINSHVSGFASTPAGMSAAFAAFQTALGASVRDGPGGTGCALELAGITAEVLPSVEVFERTSSGPGPTRLTGSHGIAGFGIAGRTDNSVPCPGPTMFTSPFIFGGSQVLDVLPSKYIIFGFDFESLYRSAGYNPVLPFNDFSLPRISTGFWLVKDAAVVPEPATFGLFGLGLLALARRRSKG
jgi:hypothetical protein